ncbi:MAG: DHH family phosphoesterase [Patescibacteria group bacterium]|nr:DHH family phosphoesterase [Patescibacteria group bacterium]
MEEKYKKIINKIKQANNILLVAHNRPDGDAVASLCAVSMLIESFDKNYRAYTHDEPPKQFSYLKNYEKIIFDKSKINFKNFDLIITLDCGHLSRTKLVDEINTRISKQYVAEIDHHPKLHDYTDLEIRDESASSTCEIIYNIITYNKIQVNKDLATAILTGIMTDTGNFFYDLTTEKTIQAASEMMRYGARFPLILENTWRNKSINGMKIWGIAMRRLYVNSKYNMAVTVLTRQDFVDTGATDEEMEGIPGFLSGIADADTLLVLRELDDGTIKGSLRSMNKKKDISKLAGKLGGGGHLMASAFAMDVRIKKEGTRWKID